MHVVLFNGPPRAGKDLAAEHLVGHHAFERFRFSDPLKQAMCSFLDERFSTLERNKDEPCDAIPYGRTFRECQISLSEEWAKTFFGEPVFGVLLARRVERFKYPLIAVPDSGFVPELHALYHRLPDAKFLLVRVHRPGCDFSNDSRSYIDTDDVQHLDRLRLADVHNNESIRVYLQGIAKLVSVWREDTSE